MKNNIEASKERNNRKSVIPLEILSYYVIGEKKGVCYTNPHSIMDANLNAKPS